MIPWFYWPCFFVGAYKSVFTVLSFVLGDWDRASQLSFQALVAWGIGELLYMLERRR